MFSNFLTSFLHAIGSQLVYVGHDETKIFEDILETDLHSVFVSLLHRQDLYNIKTAKFRTIQ